MGVDGLIKSLQEFLGTSGYSRAFCHKFDPESKDMGFNGVCERNFGKVFSGQNAL